MSKQSTLVQFLPRSSYARCQAVGNVTNCGGRYPMLSTHTKSSQQASLDDVDDDAELLLAVDLFEAQESLRSAQPSRLLPEPGQSFDGVGTNQDLVQSTAAVPERIPGFDSESGRKWIYPINFPKRDYQANISERALFENTLVILPTGLGKTFIAAVVMYNFYRWYPNGKVIFMAPTKPLVAQQIEACSSITGVPRADTVEMTGSVKAGDRAVLWREKRVFFLTPQVLTNDLAKGTCPADLVRCLVVDEAHKATGNHAYCQVVRDLLKSSALFRVLALSATPGSDIKTIQQVITNLLISRMELRCEDSLDVRKYCHQRHTEKVVVPLGPAIRAAEQRLLDIIRPQMQWLEQRHVIKHRDNLGSWSNGQLLSARDQFRQNPPQAVARSGCAGAVEGMFCVCISLYHAYQLLLNHGLRSCYNYLAATLNGEKSNARFRGEMSRSTLFSQLMDMLKAQCGATVNTSNVDLTVPPTQVPDISNCSHPKLIKLQEVLLEHFRACASTINGTGPGGTTDSRVMVFAGFRDSVEEIAEVLRRHRPLVRPMKFVGQAQGKSSKGISQKEQVRVVREFQAGGYNTLVSTCIGEEGLDIGEVDLIVCYDAPKSSTRLVQRTGRTGRKRKGRIVMLVSEGKEEQQYSSTVFNKKKIHNAIANSKAFRFYDKSPRMVPRGLKPERYEMHITVSPMPATVVVAPRTNPGKPLLPSGGGNPYLTEAELRYWDSHFKLQPAETGQLIGFGKKGHVSAEVYEWTKYSLWQCALQPTSIVGHSTLCASYVQLMRFSELHKHADNQDDDAYELEMRAFQMESGEECVEAPAITGAAQALDRFCVPISMAATLCEKKLPTLAVSGEQFCELVTSFKAQDFHITADGRRINLVTMFSRNALPHKYTDKDFVDMCKPRQPTENEKRLDELFVRLRDEVLQPETVPEWNPDLVIDLLKHWPESELNMCSKATTEQPNALASGMTLSEANSFLFAVTPLKSTIVPPAFTTPIMTVCDAVDIDSGYKSVARASNVGVGCLNFEDLGIDELLSHSVNSSLDEEIIPPSPEICRPAWCPRLQHPVRQHTQVTVAVTQPFPSIADEEDSLDDLLELENSVREYLLSANRPSTTDVLMQQQQQQRKDDHTPPSPIFPSTARLMPPPQRVSCFASPVFPTRVANASAKDSRYHVPVASVRPMHTSTPTTKAVNGDQSSLYSCQLQRSLLDRSNLCRSPVFASKLDTVASRSHSKKNVTLAVDDTPIAPPKRRSKRPMRSDEKIINKQHKRRTHFRCRMIEFEAEVDSDFSVSSDESAEEDSDADLFSGSFVEHGSHVQYDDSETAPPSNSQMRAHYLQSLRSPEQYVRHVGGAAPLEECFSQAPGPEHYESYMMDSFVVPNDHVETDTSDCSQPPSPVILPTRLRRRRGITQTAASSPQQRPTKRRRLVVEEEESPRIGVHL